jgi:hypothetical protein
MDKSVSIVRVDTRHYRAIAQENWGLTKEQMGGKHVHHRVRVSDGGTNDPSNLYVCSPSFHRWCWHDGEEFVEWAGQGASKAHTKKDSRGKSVTATKAGSSTHSEKDEDGKSLHMLKLHEGKDSEGKSILARKAAKASHSKKDEQGKSVNAQKANAVMLKQEWKSLHDGFTSNAGNVAQHNRRNGWDPNARVRLP